jgi:Flp pilus assembly protein TadD
MAKSESQSASPLDQVKQLLAENRLDEAQKVLGRMHDTSVSALNVRAVCLMRSGRADEALRILNPLVFPHGGMMVDPAAPIQVKVNYATALLLSGNLPGCTSALAELRDEKAPSVEKLRQAIARWRKSQGLLRRLTMALGMEPYNAKVTLDYPPGDI